MKRRTFGAVIVTLALVGTLAACSSSDKTDNSGSGDGAGGLTGKISFLEKWPDPQYKVYFDQIVADFIAENPGVEIDHQAVGDQPIKDQLRVLTSANELPDIYFAWPGDFAKKFARGGYAADLGEYLDGTDWGNTFAESALGAYKYDDIYYGVPINVNAKVFVYSTIAFEAAGVQVPTSYDELLASCKPLADAGYTPIAFGNQYGWPAIHYITQLNAELVPADVRSADYDPAGGAFTDPGYVEALAKFKELMDNCSKPGANGISHETAQADLVNGNAAMHYLEIVEFVNIEDPETIPAEFIENWDQFVFPPIEGAAGSPGAITGAPDGFLINAKSDNIELAIEFLKFMTNKANATLLTEVIGWPSPIEGATTPENSSAPMAKALEEIGAATEMAIWLDTETNAEVAQAYLAGVEGLLDGSETPESVMASVQQVAAKVAAELPAD